MSNEKRAIPMMVPNIGGGMVPYDLTETVYKKCPACDHEYFDAVYRIGNIPKIAPKNRTGQDIFVKGETFLCRKCGHEYGKPVFKA